MFIVNKYFVVAKVTYLIHLKKYFVNYFIIYVTLKVTYMI